MRMIGCVYWSRETRNTKRFPNLCPNYLIFSRAQSSCSLCSAAWSAPFHQCNTVCINVCVCVSLWLFDKFHNRFSHNILSSFICSVSCPLSFFPSLSLSLWVLTSPAYGSKIFPIYSQLDSNRLKPVQPESADELNQNKVPFRRLADSMQSKTMRFYCCLACCAPFGCAYRAVNPAIYLGFHSNDFRCVRVRVFSFAQYGIEWLLYPFLMDSECVQKVLPARVHCVYEPSHTGTHSFQYSGDNGDIWQVQHELPVF